MVGDIEHSRVARSAWQALTTLGIAEFALAGPPHLMPAPEDFPGSPRYDSVDAAVADADVVMALRIQRERMQEAQIPDDDAYCRAFGITAERLARARPDAIVMHPGPMNRGVEITPDVADGPQSVIRQQVTNGVAVRMAVLATVVRNVQARRHFQ